MKAWIYVQPTSEAGTGSSAPAAAPHRICWYVGTSDMMIERALRAQLRLPTRTRLLLRDADGDLVPVSAALPHEQSFTVVLAPPHPDDDDVWSHRAEAGGRGDALSVSVDREDDGGQGNDRRGRKRPRNVRDAAADIDAAPTPVIRDSDAFAVVTPMTVVAPRARSVAQVVTQFLDVFTRPIADDDNVGFIPSTGRFSLYALFCALVEDRALHPKSQDAFYKMTSMQGKVDRQRAIRYYRAPGGNGATEYVRYRPQGKGPLLRQYLVVDSASALAAVARSAEPLAAILDRDADEAVARYMDFVRGFVPVSKAEYQAHRGRDDEVAHADGGEDSNSGLRDE